MQGGGVGWGGYDRLSFIDVICKITLTVLAMSDYGTQTTKTFNNCQNNLNYSSRQL